MQQQQGWLNYTASHTLFTLKASSRDANGKGMAFHSFEYMRFELLCCSSSRHNCSMTSAIMAGDI